MLLPEWRGKELLKRAGARIPPGIVTDNSNYINLSFHKERYKEFFAEHRHVVIKAQVIAGKRLKTGLISFCDNYDESLKRIDAMYRKEWNGAPITKLLIEKKLDVEDEHFLAIRYDTGKRMPQVILSKDGGINIEEQGPTLAACHVSITEGMHDYQARQLAMQAGLNDSQVVQLILAAWRCFARYDCRQLEINPIIRTGDGLLYAGDAKITIDDAGIARQEIFADVTEVEDRSRLTPLALEARKIDYHDHRGVAGRTFMELDGDIAVMASGGGASLAVMDALIEAGGKPANYTEYSGNPPREKVKRLAELTLSKPGLKGCLVVGGRANFTDIFETLGGFMDAVETISPPYPIVIRRAGPRDIEAFAMVRQRAKKFGCNVELHGEEMPMTKAARLIVEATHAAH